MIPIQYNIRSLINRPGQTFAALFGIAMVVFVFASSSMLGEGIKRTLGKSGSADVALVLRKGSDAELSSGLQASDVSLIVASKGVKQVDGSPSVVKEIVGVLALDKVGAAGFSNVQLRGTDPDAAMRFRPETKIISGRMYKSGTEDAIVGKSILGRFKGLDLGGRIEIKKNRSLKIVGVFEDGGSSHESEIWADADLISNAFGREGGYASVRLKLESTSAFASLKRSLESNRQFGVDVMREDEFLAKQSEGTSMFITVLGSLIAFFVSLGAIIGAMVTMYASVASRIREIGTLRALGFRRLQVLGSFLLEALVLALGGGVLGIALSLCMSFVRFPILNFASWSEVIFTFEPTLPILVSSILTALVVGVFGGLLPAIRASRVKVLSALKGII